MVNITGKISSISAKKENQNKMKTIQESPPTTGITQFLQLTEHKKDFQLPQYIFDSLTQTTTYLLTSGLTCSILLQDSQGRNIILKPY